MGYIYIWMFMVGISNCLVDTTMEHVPSTSTDLANQNGQIPVRKLLVYQRLTTF